MSREFPDWINPWKAAEGRRRVAGTLPLSRLERLKPLLAEDSGTADFQLDFSLDDQRRVQIDVLVAGALRLLCQRSLEPYTETVERRSQVTVIADPTEEAGLPEGVEAVLVDNGQLAVASVVEDELLLALPLVPHKPGTESVSWSSGVVQAPEPEPSAFAALAALRSTGTDGQESDD